MYLNRLGCIHKMTFLGVSRLGARRRPTPTAGWLLSILLAAVIVVTGCASHRVDEKDSSKPVKLITDFVTAEDAETVSFIVRSNQPLTYSAVKQPEPPGIYFQFPETVLDGLDSVYFPPPNPVIRSVRVEESGGRKTETRIFLELLRDVPYMVVPEGHDLRIVFAQPGASLPPPGKPPMRMPELGAVPAAPPQPQQTATVVKEVSVTPSADRVVIRVTADGPVKDVRAFTIEDQAKIVFDLVGLRSVYRGEQRISVQSPWVSQVRHFGHPDKVRLVVETDKAHLNAYAVDTVSDGLVVTVGQKPMSALRAPRLARAQPVD